MRISQLSILVMGSAWRNLTFLKLTTDEGLTGISEVRLSNRTNALLGYLEECKKRYVLGTAVIQTTFLAGQVVGAAGGGIAVAFLHVRPSLVIDAGT